MKPPAKRSTKSKNGRKASARRKTAKAAGPRASARVADPLDAFIAGAAHRLGLKIEPAWMSGVRANVELTLALGAQVGEFALPDEAEPAPVFRA